MGNPIATNTLRFSLYENYSSTWSISNKQTYIENLIQDNIIRNFIYKLIGPFPFISQIYISKTIFTISITITLFKMSTKFFEKAELNTKLVSNFYNVCLPIKVTNFIKKTFNKDCIITYNFLTNPYLDANIIANYINFFILDDKSYKFIFSFLKKRYILYKITGLKIQISGRLDGIEKAITICKQFGIISINTLHLKIDYACKSVKTIHGLIGTKVWIYKSI